ncbi:hypothetical protein P3X46_000444 [Hevea brasiliensis]|uniref:PGG domain-containing protein n=1 Tax=Hevea brasiliensis TaxID=3981 RepID=A0ABQ9NCE8_HEVBR|nr:uncharacterized protein LOC110651336 [Hevea brasiliensis]KAJ9189113.1 hypothetical protein P3X46_000444 [Hevea brasiliensis]
MTDELNSTVAAGDKKIAAPLSSSTSVNTEAKSRKQRNRSSDEHNSLPSGNKHQGLNVKPRESFIFNAVMVIICVCIAGILIWVAVDGTPIDSYEDTIGLTIVFISTFLLMAIASYFGFLAFLALSNLYREIKGRKNACPSSTLPSNQSKTLASPMLGATQEDLATMV